MHAWGNDAVAKVPRRETPDAWIEAEARFDDVVHAAGGPVPEFLGFDRHDGRPVSVFRRVVGPSMWDLAATGTAQAAAVGGDLADVQYGLLDVPTPVSLPAQSDRLRAKIRSAVARVGVEVMAAADLVADGPSQLCHGDLHPGNVIVGDDGPVVVDWFDAGRGDPVGDVARSRLLLADASLAVTSREGTGALAAPLVVALTDAYVDRAGERFDIDRVAEAQWHAVMAVARIAEGVPTGPLLDVWRRWHSTDRVTGDETETG